MERRKEVKRKRMCFRQDFGRLGYGGPLKRRVKRKRGWGEGRNKEEVWVKGGGDREE